MQKFSVLAVAFLVVSSVAYFGTHQNQASHAASVGTLSLSPASGMVTTGNTVTVSMQEDSGTDTVNAVQATVNYDASQLQYVSLAEGTAFQTIAATSTGVSGQVRLARGTLPGMEVTGLKTIAALTFKVIGSSGTATVAYDPAGSYIVRSTDNTNILTATTNASFSTQLPAPTVTAVSPASGPTVGGTQITLTGTNLVPGASVTVGGTPASGVSFVSPTSLLATVPAHAYGPVNVVLTNPDGQTVTITNGFTYVAPAPTITTISPTSGLVTGTNSVSVAGTNFLSGAVVRIGGIVAQTTGFQTGVINVTAPAHVAGTVDVTVTNPDAQVATKVGGYTYSEPAPTVSAVTPLTGSTAGGTQLTIGGTNFVSGSTVSVGGVAATGVVFNSTTSLTAVTPAHAAGAVNVVVTTPAGLSGTRIAGFTYVNPAPTVTGVSPTTGVVGGGTSVTITGTNFLGGAAVTFGSTRAASVAYVSSTTLVAISPAGVAGPVSVFVTNSDGLSSSAGAPIFTYVSNPGDANGDGRVNAIDLSILISHDSQNYPAADFNGDGTVGSADLAILLGRWTW